MTTIVIIELTLWLTQVQLRHASAQEEFANARSGMLVVSRYLSSSEAEAASIASIVHCKVSARRLLPRLRDPEQRISCRQVGEELYCTVLSRAGLWTKVMNRMDGLKRLWRQLKCMQGYYFAHWRGLEHLMSTGVGD